MLLSKPGQRSDGQAPSPPDYPTFTLTPAPLPAKVIQVERVDTSTIRRIGKIAEMVQPAPLYVHQNYPKVRHHRNGDQMQVGTLEEERRLTPAAQGWFDLKRDADASGLDNQAERVIGRQLSHNERATLMGGR